MSIIIAISVLQVKIWFQNRRSKVKKLTKQHGGCGGGGGGASLSPGDEQPRHQKQQQQQEGKEKGWTPDGSGAASERNSDTPTVSAADAAYAEAEESNTKPILPSLLLPSSQRHPMAPLLRGGVQVKSQQHSPTSYVGDSGDVMHHYNSLTNHELNQPMTSTSASSAWSGYTTGGVHMSYGSGIVGSESALLQRALVQHAPTGVDMYNSTSYLGSTAGGVMNSGQAGLSASATYSPWFLQQHPQHHHPSAAGQMT